ncbi:MAG: hypothetical protein MJ201_01370 [Mycoplasmoidaceae bacterium]|nr:hypothetical protein [Mycoplasmoidaceae bacterium]
MYRFLVNKDKKLINEMKSICNQIIRELQNEVNEDDFFEIDIRLVGSGRKSLITQNGNQPIDLDYNLLIVAYDKNTVNINKCGPIKEYFINKLNEILSSHKYSNCQDSTSAITSQKFKSKTKKGTLFSFDIAITIDDKFGTRYRLIHKKTGKIQNDIWV